jgi:putative methyltransferase (TIGR04325 family)
MLPTLKRVAKQVLPPMFTGVLQSLRTQFHKPVLEFAGEYWNTPRAKSECSGWNNMLVAEVERARWNAFNQNLQGTGPLGFSHEHSDASIVRNLSFHNIHITYAYVLALLSHNRASISILDWGGGLGHYYQLGKVVLPDLTLDFHCKDVQVMAEAGRRINPEIHWYSDESCLENSYDLVIISASLQYLDDWKEELQRIACAAKGYLFLMRVPIVSKASSFLAIQRVYGTEMKHRVFNQSELLRFIEETGLRLVREFVVGDYPYIKNAPEPCEMRSFLFKSECR